MSGMIWSNEFPRQSFRRVHTATPLAAAGVVLLLFAVLQAVSAAAAAFHAPSAGPEQGSSAESALQQALSVRQISSNVFRIGKVEFDKARRIVSMPARVCIRNEVVEYALVAEKGKTYESLFSTEARPVDIHTACLLLGLSAVPVSGEMNLPAPVPLTNAITIEVSWETNGRPVHVLLPELICITSGRRDTTAPSMRVQRWLYNGSTIDQAGFAAQREGSIVSLIRDPAALINNPAPDRDNDTVHFPNPAALPAEGINVRITMRLPAQEL
jgi:hypothetical protein